MDCSGFYQGQENYSAMSCLMHNYGGSVGAIVKRAENVITREPTGEYGFGSYIWEFVTSSKATVR
ncbi:MAG: hypothetical protein LBL62_07705 [Planctomycetaceae bacterium]|jgi:hypothetical protein|nr:hypothetical protein [Planctomycetaceae bacterium]